MDINHFDKLINFLKGNHTWTRIYKPNELTDPIARAIELNGEKTSKKLDDIFSKVTGLKGEKGDKGDDGKDADEARIIREVLKKIVIPKPSDGKDADEERVVKNVIKQLKKPKDGKDAIVDYPYIVKETIREIENAYPGWKPLTGFEIQEIIREGTSKIKGFTKEDRKSILSELKKEAQKAASSAKNVSYSLWQRAIGIKNLDDVDLTAPTNGQALVYESASGKWKNGTVSGSGSPGGSDTQVQFNDGGSFGGDSGMTYNKTTNALTVGDVLVDNEAYDATNWDGSLEVPTKNAVRDKIEAILGSSGITRTVVVTSGSATMGSSASTDYAYFVAGAHTMSLPAASGNTNRYTVKNNHSANITVDTAGAETIEGAASISIAPGESVDILSNGTNFYVI